MSPTVWVVLAVLIAANALYVAAEFGAVGVRRSRVRRLADDGHWLARRLLPHVEDPAALDRYVGASQIGITLSSLMVGAYAQATISPAVSRRCSPRWFTPAPAAALSVAAVVVLVVPDRGPAGPRRAGAEGARAAVPDQTALATVLPMPGRSRSSARSSACSTARPCSCCGCSARPTHGHQPPALAGGDRPADRREPRWRPARAAGTAAPAPRAAPGPRTSARPDGPARSADDARRSGPRGTTCWQTVSASPFSRLPVYRERARRDRRHFCA